MSTAALALRNLKIIVHETYKGDEQDLFWELRALIDQAERDARYGVIYSTPASIQADEINRIAQMHAEADGRTEANTDDLVHATQIITNHR